MSFREGVISDEYGYPDFVHVFRSVVGGDTIEVTYTPPKGYWGYPYRFRLSQTMPAGVFRIHLYFDGTLLIENLTITDASSGVLNSVPSHTIKKRMILVITNTDTMAHTFDMYIPLAVVEEKRWEEFLLDVRGDKYEVELSKETIDALADKIAAKLRGLLPLR